MDRRESICGRLGDLAASAAPAQDRLPDAREWGHISQQLDRRARWHAPRRLVPVVAFCLILVVGGGLLVAQRPLGYRVQGCTQANGGAVCSTAGLVAFTDGTRVSLDSGARLRILPLSFGRGAELSLDEGDATLAVVHRTRSRWAVLAGPFRIEVTGTRFSVHWSKSRQVLDVAVQEGEVHVSGGTLAHATVLRSGQRLRAEARPPVMAATTTGNANTPPPSPAETTANVAPGESGARPVARAHPPATRAWPPTKSSRRRPEARLGSTGGSTAPVAAGVGSEAAEPNPAMPAAAAPSGPSRPPAKGVALRSPGDEASWARGQSFGMSPPKVAPTPKLAMDQVILDKSGRLAGGMTGKTWLAAGTGTTFSSPVTRAKRLRLLPGADGLCTSGTVAALSCVNEKTPHARCNWRTNWGVAIGLDASTDGQAWGEVAAGGIAVEFHGRSSFYRLSAHRKGDPEQKVYCIENYKSGTMVRPSQFKSRCWENAGDTLPDFKSIDTFFLQFPSGMEYVGFHYCIAGIRLER